MKKQFKRIMAVLLGTCMVLSCAPTSVFAATERHWSYGFDGVKGTNFANSGFSFSQSEYSTNQGATHVLKSGWSAYGRPTGDEMMMVTSTIPGSVAVKDNWSIGASATGCYWETFASRGCTEARYIHVGFDFALSEKENTQADAYLETRIGISDKNGTTHAEHMFGFGTGNWVVLCGQNIGYKYDPCTWLRVDYVIDTVTSTVDAYLNGTKMLASKQLSYDMNGTNAGFSYIKFNILDSKTAVTDKDRTFDIYIDDVGFDFTVNEYKVKNYIELSEASGRKLELTHSRYGDMIDNENGLIYTSKGMTAGKILDGIDGKGNKDDYFSIVKMNKTAGDWNYFAELSDDDLLESSHINSDGINGGDLMRKMWLRAKVVQEGSAPRVTGRVYYVPIADTEVVSVSSDGIDTEGFYNAGETLNIKVASSASDATVKVLVAQYTANNELDGCEVKTVTTDDEKAATINYTPKETGGDLKIYLWNDKMQAFDTATVLQAVPVPTALISADAVDNLVIDNSEYTIEAYGQDIESLTANFKKAEPRFGYK